MSIPDQDTCKNNAYTYKAKLHTSFRLITEGNKATSVLVHNTLS